VKKRRKRSVVWMPLVVTNFMKPLWVKEGLYTD